MRGGLLDALNERDMFENHLADHFRLRRDDPGRNYADVTRMSGRIP